MHFGERDEMLALAMTRLDEVRLKKPQATLVDWPAVRVIYLCEYDPSYYYTLLSAGLSQAIKPLSRRDLLTARSS
jgi:hypothetical protein